METKKYNRLSSEERDKIAILRATGLKPSEIARILGCNKSTIYRELNRNKAPIYDVYLAHKAQERAQKRKQQAAQRPRLKNDLTKQYVISKLKKGWSPEQISGRLPLDYPGLSISYEAIIYQYVYDPYPWEQVDLVSCLARSHRKRKKRGQGKKHSKSHIPNRVCIDERPQYIEQRKQLGHWEADTMISRQTKAALVVQVNVGADWSRSANFNRKVLLSSEKHSTIG